MTESNFDPRVALSQLRGREGSGSPYADEEVTDALAHLARQLGWAEEGRGAFGRIIPPGARVVVKPNFVTHENEGPWGLLPLVTHQSIVRAAVESALAAGASEVLVGDAPVQSCDFDQLLKGTGLDAWAEALMKKDARFKGVRDLRRTTCAFVEGVRVAEENLQPEENFVLFDLGGESLLEPITNGRDRFRVTCYDPKLLARTHTRGRHQYLVAREIIEADVVINLPKLKTHKKAGVTCALKNLIGINGNKEYLPHHRVGGSETGGDCYPGKSLLKSAREHAADRQNMAASATAAKFWHGVNLQLDRALRLQGDELGIEGSWSGNDTIWRTCLDLNRVLLYGRPDATLSDRVERRVVHLVDAIVAGQGNGPLAPQPLPLNLMFAGETAAAVDWVGARLLGYDPQRIPIVREAFNRFQWPLTRFSESEITLRGDFGDGSAEAILGARSAPEVIYPGGWRDAVLSDRNGSGTKPPEQQLAVERSPHAK